jgi:hypothetical protein
MPPPIFCSFYPSLRSMAVVKVGCGAWSINPRLAFPQEWEMIFPSPLVSHLSHCFRDACRVTYSILYARTSRSPLGVPKMMKVARIIGAAGLALVSTACGGSAGEKYILACERMVPEAGNLKERCACMANNLKVGLNDSEVSELADLMNRIVDNAKGDSRTVARDYAGRIMGYTLVNQKVSLEVMSAEQKCPSPAPPR